MKTTFLLALVPLAILGVVAARAAPIDYKLPEETATMRPGPASFSSPRDGRAGAAAMSFVAKHSPRRKR